MQPFDEIKVEAKMKAVSIPQAVGAVATKLEGIAISKIVKVSIPQAVGAVAT